MRTVLVLSAVLALFAVGAVGVVAQSATTRPPARPAAAKPTTTVNLNTATAAELQTLPGIGARTADRILEYRQKKGPFKKIEETLENPRSCPYLLSISSFVLVGPVSHSR